MLVPINTSLFFRDVAWPLTFRRAMSSRNISKLSRYALQAIVIPEFYTGKVGLSEGKFGARLFVTSQHSIPSIRPREACIDLQGFATLLQTTKPKGCALDAHFLQKCGLDIGLPPFLLLRHWPRGRCDFSSFRPLFFDIRILRLSLIIFVQQVVSDASDDLRGESRLEPREAIEVHSKNWWLRVHFRR